MRLEFNFRVRTDPAMIMNKALKVQPAVRRDAARKLRERTANMVQMEMRAWVSIEMDELQRWFHSHPVEVEILPFRKERCDIDAVAMMVKPILDGMVDANLIPDDSTKIVQRLMLLPAVVAHENAIAVSVKLCPEELIRQDVLS